MTFDKQPILITGAERSGSTLIARVIEYCGGYTGVHNNMYENKCIIDFNLELLKHNYNFPTSDSIPIQPKWKNVINGVRVAQNGMDRIWYFKHSTLARLWRVYAFAFPQAKWIIVRRKTPDIIKSCVKTGYMTLYKDENRLKQEGFKTEEEGWLSWIHIYEERFIEMFKSVNCKVVWPERMVAGDYEQLKEVVEWVGLQWNEKVPELMKPLLINSKDLEG